MIRKRTLGLLLVPAAVVAFADSHVRIVRFSAVGHGVEISARPESGAGRSWSQVMLNQPVVEGETVRTTSAGPAEVELECGSALRLAPNSEFTFPVLRRTDGGLAETTVAVIAGTSFLSIRHADSRGFHLRVPGAVISTSQGAAKLRVEVPGPDSASVQLLAGHAAVEGLGGSRALDKSEKLAWSGSGPMHKVAADPPGPWGAWSHNRDNEFQRAIMESRPGSGIFSAQNSLPGRLGFPMGPVFDPAPPFSMRPPASTRPRPDLVPQCASN